MARDLNKPQIGILEEDDEKATIGFKDGSIQTFQKGNPVTDSVIETARGVSTPDQGEVSPEPEIPVVQGDPGFLGKLTDPVGHSLQENIADLQINQALKNRPKAEEVESAPKTGMEGSPATSDMSGDLGPKEPMVASLGSAPVTNTTTRTTRTYTPKSLLDNTNRSMESLVDTQRKLTDEQIKKDADYKEKIEKANEEHRLKQEDLEKQKKLNDLAVAARKREADRLHQEAKDMKVDPNRLFSNMDTPRKIGAGISVFLGALGSALTGDENKALEVINKAIDRDIAQQKMEVNRADQRAKDADNRYFRYKQTLGSEFAAEHALAADKYQAAINQAMQVREFVSPEMRKLMDEKLIQGMVFERNQHLEQAHQISEQTISVTATPEPKKLEDLEIVKGPDAKQDISFHNVESILADMQEFYERADAEDFVGPIDGRLIKLAPKLGIAPNTEAIKQAVREGLAVKQIQFKFSGQQATDREAQYFADLGPSLETDPKAALAKIQELRQRNRNEYDTFRTRTIDRYQGDPRVVKYFSRPLGTNPFSQKILEQRVKAKRTGK